MIAEERLHVVVVKLFEDFMCRFQFIT
jgi:hypothetical protein